MILWKSRVKWCKIPVHQCANSAAIMEMPETSLSLSRAGISMYGLYPSDEMDHEAMKLEPAMSIYSHVIYVKEIPAGEKVSYGGTFTTTRTTKLATVSVGYGDGYPRALSSKGYVLVRGQKPDCRQGLHGSDDGRRNDIEMSQARILSR